MESKELEKVRRANVRNLLAKVRDGKPLNKEQLELVRQEMEDKPTEMPPSTKTLSTQEFSNLVNLDKRRVQQLAKQGVIEKEGRGNYPLAQVTSYIRYLQELVQQRKIQPDEEEDALNPEQEKARKDKEGADKLELENKVSRGELVPADEIDEAWADIALSMRAKLLGMGAKLTPVLEGMSKKDIKATIDQAMRQALEELARNDDDVADE